MGANIKRSSLSLSRVVAAAPYNGLALFLHAAMVPHLITALTGPINELEQRILDSMPAIERWFRLEWMEHTPPFYTSVDIRNAGF